MRRKKELKFTLKLTEYEAELLERLKEKALITYGWDYSITVLLSLIVRGLLKNPKYLYKLVIDNKN